MSYSREDHYHGRPTIIRAGSRIRKFLIGLGLAMAAFGMGCGLAQLTDLARIGAQVLVQFVMNKTGDLIGTSFVAEGKLYTAKHVADAAGIEGAQVASDLVSIGDSPLQGYHICRKAHKGGDKVRVTVGPWPGVLPEYEAMLGGTMKDSPEMWAIFLAYPMLWGGVSGSPVLCDEHNGVVGVICQRMRQNWMVICRFPVEAQ